MCWTFRFRWPDDIRSSIDNHYEIHKSLDTHHLGIALERRNYLLAICKRFVGAVRAGDKGEVNKLRKELEFFIKCSDNANLDATGILTNLNVEKDGEFIDTNLIQLVEDGWKKIEVFEAGEEIIKLNNN